MSSLSKNKKIWRRYAYYEQGDEWSIPWGGTSYLWTATILPRIQAMVPKEHILEIAPGYGRLTQYLSGLCEKLSIVDVTKKCIDHCKNRFGHHSNIKYFVNDGRSLSMLDNDSIDFVFSWDSLVHVEYDVIRDYLRDLSIKLKPNGCGFLHHSNFGIYDWKKKIFNNPHLRASSVTAKFFRDYCRSFGLMCVAQEIVSWGGIDRSDCFSFFVRNDNRNEIETIVYENFNFDAEVDNARKISELFRRPAFGFSRQR